jgi:hypothetical protein
MDMEIKMVEWLVFGVVMIPFIAVTVALIVECIDEYRK